MFLAHFQSHILNSSNFNQHQSVYRPGCSTEMALHLFFNRIYSTADAGKPTLLISLDLSAAFDTIDHALYLNATSGSSPICIGLHSSPVTSCSVPSLDRCFFRYTRHRFSRLLSHTKFISSSMQTTQLYLALSPSSYTHDISISTLQSCLDSLHICFCENGIALFCLAHHRDSNLCLVSSLSMSLGQSFQFLIRSRYLVQHLIPTLQRYFIPKLYPVPAFITSTQLNRFVRPWMTAWLVPWHLRSFRPILIMLTLSYMVQR